MKASESSPDRLSKRCVASEMLRLDGSLESGDTFVAKIIVLQIRSGKFCPNLGAFEHDLHTQLSNGQRKMMKVVLMGALDNFCSPHQCCLNEGLTFLSLKIFSFPILQYLKRRRVSLKVKTEIPDSPQDLRSVKYSPWATSVLLFIKFCWNTVLLFKKIHCVGYFCTPVTVE